MCLLMSPCPDTVWHFGSTATWVPDHGNIVTVDTVYKFSLQIEFLIVSYDQNKLFSKMQRSAQLEGIKYWIMKYKVLYVAQISGILKCNEDNRTKKKPELDCRETAAHSVSKILMQRLKSGNAADVPGWKTMSCP